jgi:hypothetical protein
MSGSIAATEHFAQDHHVLSILRSIGRFLRPDDVLERCSSQVYAEYVEPNRVAGGRANLRRDAVSLGMDSHNARHPEATLPVSHLPLVRA